jgi:uncharacterized protein YlxW (UPF0749 family)
MTETTPAQARARLRHALSWDVGTGTVISTVLFAIMGFVAAVQIAAPDDALGQASRADLVQILNGLNTRADELEDEVARLEEARAGLLVGAGDSEAAQAEAEERLDTLGILSGEVAATGPGVGIVISDPGGGIDAASMLSIVQELRDAGAEALQISGGQDRAVRIVASTAFVDLPTGEIAVGGVGLNSPYSIVALGDPATLATALGIPGGALSSIEGAGASVSVTESNDLLVDALHTSTEPSYARPAVPDAAESG